MDLTKDTVKVFDENSEDGLIPSEEVEATIVFKCDLFYLESVSDKGLRQHIGRKHQI